MLPFPPSLFLPLDLLTSCTTALQDVVTRFAASNGYHVTRRFGWDCHGLPVEFEIDKKLGLFPLEGSSIYFPTLPGRWLN